ncbi:GNAT family N-acetyltransferase [Herbaspirillum sp. AP02]|uniref:GNAT family N-acetyltransferase n=1 Tax=unclassified Herbaspirillum TaxID=2624150 RepID=UPI0015DB7AE4|nr:MULTISPECIES: GNAT family N-acetyltransferase [unclassified Herbaspirillum]MBG7618745.1 GNAT family N-acetyltransferase [Herbaspirillum sp. AP02]NZD67453.1 GNAT family N-acetyltransferase [Herbaspirillum sp. AP21]
MAVSIVKADLDNAAHAAALFETLNAYASDAMGGGQALSDYVRQNLAAELKKRSTAHVFLAFDGNTPAGLATCIEGFSTFSCKPLLNLHDLAVMPAYRGQGVARQLLASVERQARALGCCKLTLEVLEGNTVARSLYRASGFAGYELKAETGKAMFMQKLLD